MAGWCPDNGRFYSALGKNSLAFVRLPAFNCQISIFIQFILQEIEKIHQRYKSMLFTRLHILHAIAPGLFFLGLLNPGSNQKGVILGNWLHSLLQ